MTDVNQNFNDQLSLLEIFVENCPFAVVEFLPSGKIIRSNSSASKLLVDLSNATEAEDDQDLFALLTPSDSGLRTIIEENDTRLGLICRDFRQTILLADPERPSVTLSISIIRLAENRATAVIQDVSGLLALEEKLRFSEVWAANAPEPSGAFASLFLDQAGTIIDCAPVPERVVGYTAADLIGQSFTILYADRVEIGDRLLDRLDYAEQSGWHVDEAWYAGKDGHRRRCSSVILPSAPLDSDGSRSFSMVIRDVAERQTSTDELRRLATTDHLTGLYNRSYFMGRTATEIARWRRYGRGLTLIMVDADRFKRINDEYGHLVGDAVLRDMANRLRAGLRSIDIAARFGGEEFIALLPSTLLSGALIVAERIRRDIESHPVLVEGTYVTYTVSLGIAEFTSENNTIESVTKLADDALYRAKRTGRNRVCVSQQRHDVVEAVGGVGSN